MAKAQVKSKPKVKRSDIEVGRWVRVIWECVGARDCVCVYNDGDSIRVYEPMAEDISWAEIEQVIAVGSYLTAEHSGL
jgi:hypothetical protein